MIMVQLAKQAKREIPPASCAETILEHRRANHEESGGKFGERIHRCPHPTEPDSVFCRHHGGRKRQPTWTQTETEE